MSNWVVAIATTIYACLTFWIIKQNHDIIALNYLPFLQVYLEQDETEPTMIGLKIENIGKGIARNIRLNIVDGDNDVVKYLKNTGIFLTGLLQLSPGKIIFLPNIARLLGTSLLETESVLKIEIYYQDRNGKIISDIFKLHFNYLKNFYCVKEPSGYKIAKSLANIEKSQANIEKSFNRIVSKVERFVNNAETTDLNKSTGIITESIK